MYVVLEWICQILPSSVKRNFGTSVWMVLHDLHGISAFWYCGSQKVVVVERECSKPAENQQTLITNRLRETLVLAQNTINNEKIKIFRKASLWPWQMTFLLFNVYLASSCIFVQKRKYLRWRDFKIFLKNRGATKKSQVCWPLTFCLTEQYAPSFYRSHFKYGVRSLNTQHFHSYYSSKKILFMGQNDLDPRTIDLNLNVHLAIEILYQYEYVPQVERLNYGAITACLRKGAAIQCKIQ